MRTIHRKLLRDLVDLKGQVAAIAVVVAAGVMTLIIAVTTLDAISLTKDRFYRDYHFADVFVDLKRAPEGLAERLRDIPGVDHVETRVNAPVRLEVPGYADPVRGQLLSLPDGRQPDLNRLYLREGSLPDPGRSDQVVISEPFSEAHGLRPGDTVTAIIRGRLETMTVSGVALSPEFVYQIGPADLLPDYERFAVLWMNRRALANAFGMDGAFNNAVLTLQAGADAGPVIDTVDTLLARYGGTGAYDRDDQVSHQFLTMELDQLRVMAVALPTLFLGVAAFLLNVLMGRIVRTQRQQVAVLKAFGYSNRDMAAHYGLLTGLIVLIGVAVGVGMGAWAADALAAVYMEYFRFPAMSFRLQPQVLLLAVVVAAGAAALGTYRAVRGAVSLPPAEAMRPPAPETFRQGWLERSHLGRLLDQPTRIIVRNLARHRLKSGLSVLGIGLSGALLMVGSYQFGAVDDMLDTQYRLVQTMDINLYFTEPASAHAVAGLRHKPGVQYVEGFRNVPVRLAANGQDYRTAILGMDAEPKLRRLTDARGQPQRLPPEGLVLTDYLADYLGLRPGDAVQVEVMEGHRRTLDVELAAVVSEPVGVSAYMERQALNRLMREGPALSGVWLLTDASQHPALYEALWDVPQIAGIGLIGEAEAAIREYIDDTVLIMMGVLLLLGGSITFAVAYNNARIAFAERARELATLRVLGYTRGEVSWILLGEIAALTLLAIPLGWLLGTGFAMALSAAMSTDLFRVPFVITPQTYAFAAAGVIVATVLSVLLILRRLRSLDMVSALKTVE
ncbi:ABC transporter permease [Aquisalimonas asiatica]|uniref:Putative ABC transport system permease protein n=1 Tax=Aquisalimonas asiatica TaxID=406100 RepID=A0A1H8RHW5_9GAMM|nr:FtsX-like permease family protein [Aquisalimonas asiatica]SEO65837.1 putative ABC transport system permease protein [Aquisalimonas asiatica]